MTVSDNTDDLEAYDTWDWAAAEKRKGMPDAPINVLIKFAAPEFEAVAECAECEGMSVNDFIRTAALGAARERSSAP
jgi:hypothetical protein